MARLQVVRAIEYQLVPNSALASQCPFGNKKHLVFGNCLGSNFFIKIGLNSTNFLDSSTNLQI
jgi:hypothetical protein